MRDLLMDRKMLRDHVPSLMIKHGEFDWCVPKAYAEEYIDRAIRAEKRALIAEKALAMACEDNYNNYLVNAAQDTHIAGHWVKYWQDEAQKAI